jgi:hypothetical protein
VLRVGDTWFAYGTDDAVADDPHGPFAPAPEPLVCQADEGGLIGRLTAAP